MPGRPIPTEAELIRRGYGQPDFVRRRMILRETLDKFNKANPPDRYHQLAAANLAHWSAQAPVVEPERKVQVISGDWGDVARQLTKTYGACFAVLNMANAYVPGGAYVEGTIAQEENIFRRSDCHFQVGADEYDA